MIFALIVCILTAIGVFLSVLLKPEFRFGKVAVGSYWVISLTGAVVLLVAQKLPMRVWWQGLTANTAVNPLKILVLFLSMTALSVFLDELGFFRFLASCALKKAGGSQYKLFFILFVTVSVLTVFTSNDIVVLTFTPFICCFARRAKIDPIPYLVAEFIASNTWSMMLIIGNPTNIYIASSANIKFAAYFLVMLLPTVCAGLVALGCLFFTFRKKLRSPISVREDQMEKIEEKGALILGLLHLGFCTLFLAVGSYIGIEMWLVSLGFALSLAISYGIWSLVRKKKPLPLLATARRLPYELIPFVLSMFTIVLTLDHYAFTAQIARLLQFAPCVFSYGISSFLAANLVNNIPMSVLFSAVLQSGVPIESASGAIYAVVVGSNIGAYLTPVGALAGIMWLGILKKEKVAFSFRRFVGYGTLISLPTLLTALLALYCICK